ncbi:hypothetical protein LP419_30720 [Massilia sp. H-1]|nr:hypothetical protein LP419_30720 [Massilia sp. H-1]
MAALASQEKANELQTRLKEVKHPRLHPEGERRTGAGAGRSVQQGRRRESARPAEQARPVRQPGSELINKAGAA